MKLISPVLIPISVDLLEVFKLLENTNVKADVLQNYNYQKLDFDLLWNYVDPALQEKCRESIWESNLGAAEMELDELINAINQLLYKEYYMYFLCTYVRENGEYKGLAHFWEWLQQPRDYTIKKTFKAKMVRNIGVYNSILIPRLWKDVSLPNKLNRLRGLMPNYVDQESVIRMASEALTRKGRIIVLDKSAFAQVLFNINDDFVEIEDNVFQKNSPKPKKNKQIKLWL